MAIVCGEDSVVVVDMECAKRLFPEDREIEAEVYQCTNGFAPNAPLCDFLVIIVDPVDKREYRCDPLTDHFKPYCASSRNIWIPVLVKRVDREVRIRHNHHLLTLTPDPGDRSHTF